MMFGKRIKQRTASWRKQFIATMIGGTTLLFITTTAAAESQQVRDWNHSLAVIDEQIQSQGISPFQTVNGQAAGNIVPGVTNQLLEQKRQILLGAGFNNFLGNNYYNNAYSFTSVSGITNTQFRIVEMEQTAKLIRRGNHQKNDEITQGFLGAWWSPTYYSVTDSRNYQAILAGWGSDLQDIYVISVPKGTKLIGGIASPMVQGNEYRNGGAYQYWKRSGQSENTMPWLIYALYAPNYLASYSEAITGGQKLNRDIVEDLSLHMEELRNSYASGRKDNNGIWIRPFGNDTSYTDIVGTEYHGQTKGMQLGWEKLVKGEAIKEKNKIYIGIVGGHGVTSQDDRGRKVNNEVTGNYGGIYSVLLTPTTSQGSSYLNGAILFGNLNFVNNVPGYYGYGLKQQYSGQSFTTSLEHGMTFPQKNGMVLEPQIQLLYTSIRHGGFTDNIGANITLRKGDSLQGRLGLQLRNSIRQSNGKLIITSLGVNYIHEFKGDNVTDISGEQSQNDIGRKRYEINLGLQANLTGSVIFQGKISKRFGDEQGYQGNVSVHTVF